jgi:O-antigen ligase
VTDIGFIPAHRPAVGRAAFDLDGVVRYILLLSVFLLLWISFRPFTDLSAALDIAEISGTAINQLGYSLLFVLLGVWCLAHQPRRLVLLIRPVFVALLCWIALSVAASWEPSLAARRFAFTLITLAIAGMVLLVPRNVRQFSSVLSVAVLIVLALCYYGVLFRPSLSIHQSTDFAEPLLAGDWRGVFGHKNGAGATMVVFVFIGLFVARQRNIFLGALIVALATIFLIFTRSATAIAMLPITLAMSVLIGRMRSTAGAIAVTLSLVLSLGVFSIGSIYSEPIHKLVETVLSDPSFTGRTEIWQFTIDSLAKHPITGYGFAAFWSTPEIIYGMSGADVWANTANHAHEGYLDLAVTIGIPGAILAVLWLVVLPLVDFFRAPADSSTAPLKMLFLRVCLFAAFGSCFESMLLQEGELGLFFFTSAFALRLLSVSRTTA